MGRRIDIARHLHAIVLTAGIAAGVAAPAVAQTAPPGIGSAPPADRRETIIGGGSGPQRNLERCVEVEIGNESSLGCLNQRLRREVDRVNPSINLPPIDARSPDIRVGNVNVAAVRQQYGANFGRSAIPFRPPPPALVLPNR